jgi:Fanconi-associated nuclease 1
VHCEGSFFSTLFGLLFWNIIFDGRVPDAFATPFQTAPLDLRSDRFFERRQEAIEARVSHLVALSPDELATLVQTAWTEHLHVQGVGIAWDLFSDTSLAAMARAVGPRVVAGAVFLLAVDHRHRRGGHPDLLLYKENPPEAMFVEVKSANDRLAPKQEIWLHVLSELGANAGVCHVQDS